jgi:Metallo-beta-lactamase superfamily.
LILLVTAINEILENDNNTIQDTVLQGNLSKELKVHYIDVGQGDSILIEVGNASMLIDAGNNGDGNRIVSYIKDQGINKLDYLILTHPHADHIGGATDVIKALDIDKIIMPKVNHTSKTYENLLLTIKDKDLKITVPNTGDDYSLGGSSFKILAPNSSNYERMNDYSIVCKLTFGNTSFLFSGDAETISENEMLSKGFDLKADVLKIGHHGSNTSTSSQFLKAVSPKYAVISVGKDNSYGHPAEEILSKLAEANVIIYRTDEVGTIIATSDGNTISFDKKASTIKQK